MQLLKSLLCLIISINVSPWCCRLEEGILICSAQWKIFHKLSSWRYQQFIFMDRTTSRPIPQHSFMSFTSMLSEDSMGENLISSNDDYYPQFVPSTQVNNEEVVSEEVIIEKEIRTSEADVIESQYSILFQTTPQTKSRVRWSIANTMVLIEAKIIERNTISWWCNEKNIKCHCKVENYLRILLFS